MTENENKNKILSINENHIIDIKTVQSSAIKILIEALKEILTDANLIIDNTGIKLNYTFYCSWWIIFIKLRMSCKCCA